MATHRNRRTKEFYTRLLEEFKKSGNVFTTAEKFDFDPNQLRYFLRRKGVKYSTVLNYKRLTPEEKQKAYNTVVELLKQKTPISDIKMQLAHVNTSVLKNIIRDVKRKHGYVIVGDVPYSEKEVKDIVARFNSKEDLKSKIAEEIGISHSGLTKFVSRYNARQERLKAKQETQES